MSLDIVTLKKYVWLNLKYYQFLGFPDRGGGGFVLRKKRDVSVQRLCFPKLNVT